MQGGIWLTHALPHQKTAGCLNTVLHYDSAIDEKQHLKRNIYNILVIRGKKTTNGIRKKAEMMAGTFCFFGQGLQRRPIFLPGNRIVHV